VTPFFSIIIPTYNRAHCITIAIQSVLDQQFQDFEIIVVDDGSTDETNKIVPRINDVRIKYLRKLNEERSIARNTGILKAEGKYVTFLDSDDFYYPNHLLEAKRFIDEVGFPEVFHLNYELIRGSHANWSPDLPEIVNNQVIKNNQLSCNGVFIRKDVSRHNMFIHHRSAIYAEDTELWIRLSARYPFYHVKKITSAITMHPERSAQTIQPLALLKSTLLVRNSLLNDKSVMNTFGRLKVENFVGRRFLLAATIYTKKNKGWSLKLLKEAFKFQKSSVIFAKSFWVVMKNLILK
jgi:glycosyltransferase involved in cell wall biosynthesis